jgi:uncharacterized membrane protein YeaQ/YmgE (transglycosylase-associated protein family)
MARRAALLYSSALAGPQPGMAPVVAANAKMGETHMGWLSWVLFGLIAGIVAKFIMPGRDPGGFVITILLGIAGAFVGGWLATQLGLGSITGFDIRSFIIAVIGALILLFAYRRLRS